MKKNIEDMLFSQESVDTLIKQKMEDEIKFENDKRTVRQKKIITDIKEVPSEAIFSRSAVFKVFNRENKTISFINGIQAEAYAVMHKSSYERIKKAQIDAFYSDNMYIKFENYKIN